MSAIPDWSRRVQLMAAAGFDEGEAEDWLTAASTLFHGAGDGAELGAAATRAGRLIMRGWELVNRLPWRSQRSPRERDAGDAIRDTIIDTSRRFARAYGRDLYRDLTSGLTQDVRVDDLLWRGADRWPGVLPTRAEVAVEAQRMQKDKDGRELLQGLMASQLLSDPEVGRHLVASMLRPTDEALARLPELERDGTLDLGTAHVEIRDDVGFVYLSHPTFLNAEDDETTGPLEVATDLVLLHPGVRLCVFRGGHVEHPKYRGRRIFSAGINLTKIYHGRVSYLFYLVRDLGFVHKMYRGLALHDDALRAGMPEQTHEKLWMAVVDTFAIGGGCQILLVMDHVIAETGAYVNLPARKEGIIPGVANLRLPRFLGERLAREAIMLDRTFRVEEPAARALVNEVHPAAELEDAIARAIRTAVGSGMVSAGGNRKALRVQTEPLDTFRAYMATYAREQAFCHLSDQLVANLEHHWNAKNRRLG